MKRLLLLIIICFFLFPASASALRCNDGVDLVSTGDSKLKIISCLGEPGYKERELVRNYGRVSIIEYWFYVIDDWEYRVVFITGQVVRIENLGRQ